jgi:hypothetical protein
MLAPSASTVLATDSAPHYHRSARLYQSVANTNVQLHRAIRSGSIGACARNLSGGRLVAGQ